MRKDWHTPLDPAELRELLFGSLLRDFTSEECARFGFTDHCPTRADLRP